MKISTEKLTAVCRIGKGKECCAFIACGSDGFECLKGTELEPAIRQRLEKGVMIARGDNCNGEMEDYDHGKDQAIDRR